MAWKERIRKLGYYRDIPLLSRTFFTSFKMSLSSRGSQISSANPRQNGRTEEKEKIVKYVNLCLYLRRRLGFKDSCLTSSLLLCSLSLRGALRSPQPIPAKTEEQKKRRK